MWNTIKTWFVKTFDYNQDAKVTAEDLEVAKALAEKDIKEANEILNDNVKKVKTRVKRVKEEVADVSEAVKEVINQVEDVAAATKGKTRTGRKKKQ